VYQETAQVDRQERTMKVLHIWLAVMHNMGKGTLLNARAAHARMKPICIYSRANTVLW
jgi:hypothetical protein